MGMLLRRHYETSTDSLKAGEQDLNSLSSKELKSLAKERGVDGYSKMTKEELLEVLNG